MTYMITGRRFSIEFLGCVWKYIPPATIVETTDNVIKKKKAAICVLSGEGRSETPTQILWRCAPPSNGLPWDLAGPLHFSWQMEWCPVSESKAIELHTYSFWAYTPVEKPEPQSFPWKEKEGSHI